MKLQTGVVVTDISSDKLRSEKVKAIVLGVVSSLLATLAYMYIGKGFWFLIFLMLAILSFWYLITARPQDVENITTETHEIPEQNEISYEQLGYYAVDGDDCYGMYLKIGRNVVFVDIREDGMISERKDFCERIRINTDFINNSLREFFESHEEAPNSLVINVIGLYDKHNPFRGEVYFIDNDDEGWSAILDESLRFSSLRHSI